jgi:carbonic anhydrase
MIEQHLVATAINCIDGRVQQQVTEYLKRKLGVFFVDMITDAGPDAILAQMTDYETIRAIKKRVNISIQQHGSQHIAVIGHYDCTGNPVDARTHHSHIQSAIQSIRAWYPGTAVFGLWINESWGVEELQQT